MPHKNHDERLAHARAYQREWRKRNPATAEQKARAVERNREYRERKRRREANAEYSKWAFEAHRERLRLAMLRVE